MSDKLSTGTHSTPPPMAKKLADELAKRIAEGPVNEELLQELLEMLAVIAGCVNAVLMAKGSKETVMVADLLKIIDALRARSKRETN